MPKHSEEDLANKFFYCYRYHKYRLASGEKNPALDQISRMLMDFKNPADAKHQQAIKTCGERLNLGMHNFFLPDEEIQVAIVPSHTQNGCSAALQALIPYFERTQRVVFSDQFLVRTKTIVALKSGGNRSVQTHLDSIAVKRNLDPKLKVLLLDDIRSTGNSQTACQQLLRKHGAQTIATISLGYTVLE